MHAVSIVGHGIYFAAAYLMFALMVVCGTYAYVYDHGKRAPIEPNTTLDNEEDM